MTMTSYHHFHSSPKSKTTLFEALSHAAVEPSLSTGDGGGRRRRATAVVGGGGGGGGGSTYVMKNIPATCDVADSSRCVARMAARVAVSTKKLGL